MSNKVQEGDTIAAVASAAGPGAIGIIRISGPRAIQIAAALFKGEQSLADLPGWRFYRGHIEHNGVRLDEALCLVMRAPRSYTREDVVEFHCHGGAVVLRAVLAAVIEAGAHPALPGEFTKRAFLNGRIDLAQAEAVADMIASRTEAAARLAAAQLEGSLSNRLREIRQSLVELLALLEAGIDFADYEDVTPLEPEQCLEKLSRAGDELSTLLKDASRGRLIREGARTVIAGRTNVGKSTLMNRLLGSERVIVTSMPGTTRDVVEDSIEIKGIPVRLFDTAGIRKGLDPAEEMGVERARAALESADLALLLVDGSERVSEDDRDIAGQIKSPAVLVLNKCDLQTVADESRVQGLLPEAPLVRISALTGEGIEDLTRAVEKILLEDASMETPLLANIRHIDAISRARDALERALKACEQGMSDEFLASDLRRALDAIGEVTGETYTNELLDLIFERFCIGK